MGKKILNYLVGDVIASLFLAISIDCFAVAADFAPGGISGLAVMANYLFKLPIGWITVALNLPIILLTFRKLGLTFFLVSFKSILISSLFIDYVVCYFPVFTGARIWAALLAGVFSGIAYSLFYNEGSSTGGTDFVIVALKRKHPKTSFGIFSLCIDGSVLLFSVPVYKNVGALLCGVIYTAVTSLFIDATTQVIKKCKNTRKKPQETTKTTETTE